MFYGPLFGVAFYLIELNQNASPEQKKRDHIAVIPYALVNRERCELVINGLKELF
jgi:hypothetical protein